MGLLKMGVPEKLTEIVREKYNIKSFVETGTYYGGTTLWAAQRFEKVFTIENSKAIFDKTESLRKDRKNIEFLFGNSKDHLKNIVPVLDGPAVFWLDAHWSGGETFGVEDECPILEEIDTINASSYSHIILVDDARLFMKPPPKPHKAEQWPDISKVLEHLNQVKGRYCFIADDVIGAVPADAKDDLWPYFEEIIQMEQSLVPQPSLLGKIKSKLKI
ncbi:MAG: hypothetical protein ACOZCO_11795 [Bacteroidota bacterium]